MSKGLKTYAAKHVRVRMVFLTQKENPFACFFNFLFFLHTKNFQFCKFCFSVKARLTLINFRSHTFSQQLIVFLSLLKKKTSVKQRLITLSYLNSRRCFFMPCLYCKIRNTKRSETKYMSRNHKVIQIFSMYFLFLYIKYCYTI